MPLIDSGSTGIRPIDRQRPTDGLDRVRRRDDGGGGFRPQTTVNLKTAIQDIAATLGKIGTEERSGIQKMPQEVGEIVQNILKQSLSVDSTLAKGIGSTVESQRFSMDQLMLFSRMLLQIGTLAEKGYSMKLSDETQALLSNLKNAIVAEAGGDAFEPILMTKAAFELVDAKTAEQLPQELYEVLSQLANMPTATQQQQPPSETMQFLKQLVRYFMPRPEVDQFAQDQIPQQQQPQSQVQQRQPPQGATQRFLESMFKNLGGKFAQPQFSQPQVQGQVQTQPNQFNQSQVQGQSAQPQSNQFNQSQVQGQVQAQPQFNQPQIQGQVQAQPQVQGQVQAQSNQFNQPNVQGQVQAQPQAQFSQPQVQGQPNQFNQPQAQGQPNQFNQPQVQGQVQPQTQAQFNQPQVRGQSQPQAQFNQPQVQGQPVQPQPQFTQPQVQVQGQVQAQPQPNQFNQPQVQGQSQAQFNQPQVQGQSQAQFNQPTVQGQVQTQPQPQFTQPTVQGQVQTQPQAQFNQPTVQGQVQGQTPQPQFNPMQSQQVQPSQQVQQEQQAQFSDLPRRRRSRIKPKHVNDDFINRQYELRAQMDMAKSAMLRQNMQNTPQTNDSMKNLAQFLLRNPNTMPTPRDAALLQNFVNNSQQMMPETEARHLQNLLRLCQNNIPLTVQQAAVQQKLPDLPRLWAFMQMCDMANVTSKMNARAFKRAGKDVADFTTAMRHAMSAENSVIQNQRSFQMMMPLYMGENEKSYPTYLNVYDENTKDEETGEIKKETWFRVCVLTDYIGAAELVFRVYDQSHLDMRFYFSRIDVAEEFRSTYLDPLRNSLKATELTVGEVRVGGVGERMFSF